MKTEQHLFTQRNESCPNFSFSPNLILAFGERNFLSGNTTLENIKQTYPNTIIAGCTTSGEILGEKVTDGSLALTAVLFEKTEISIARASIEDNNNSSDKTGVVLAQKLNHNNLKHVIVFSDGLHVSGTDVVRGMKKGLPENVTVTGGLAGDGADFQQTFIVGENGELLDKQIAAIGLYGDAIEVGFSSRGGWDSFGVDRHVTKSKGNVLYEIDNQPALDLYKSFLGEQAKDLPASGLLFPLSMRDKEEGEPVVRTILAIDEDAKSLTFAGDIPEGSFVRLMKANADRLINGAEEAAETSMEGAKSNAQLAILVSCVGRKLVLKQLVEEEVEVVSDVLGKPTITGFYSYGELAPFGFINRQCELHNQTMTITTLSEAA
ncbi:MAG: FIST C-terminal domain-containing protein [Bacteroidetes bacterium]|nr:FIST C-terminal domain-containing protein [Bacteroidota bacterium]